MSSFNCHDLSSPNWNDKTYQSKETPVTSYRPSNINHNHWSLSYDNNSNTSAAVGSSYKPIVTNNSPLISTPFLDSSVDDILSPACFSPYATLSPHLNQHQPIHHPQQATDISVGQYIDKRHSIKIKAEPIFTGDPMELLIDKSKAVSASPMCSTSEDMNTPLFMPILLHDHHQQNQHTPHQAHTGHQFMMGQDMMDWPCYNDGNDLLFHALDGLMDTTTSLSMVSDSHQEDGHQFHHQYQPSSPQSTSHEQQQQQISDQYPSPSSSADEDRNNRSTEESTEKKKPLAVNNNTKRKRSNSKESTGSDSDNSQKRAKKTDTNQNEKRYGCPICRRKFSRRYNLNTHIRTHNVNRIKEFACEICGTSFDRKHDRDRHMSSVHYGTRSYPCTHCASAFCRRDALARHVLKSHRGHSS